MANFMGPMAPPPAAPGQPPQLDIRTNPNQRQRFRNFMRQNTRPAGMTGAPPMYPAAQTPFPAAPMPPMAMPAPTPLMPMQVARPMQQPMGPARNVDIFSPQYMQAQPPVGMEDGGDVPMPAVMPNSKQKDVMLRIAYDEALRKGAVENALRQLETDRVIERSKEMELDRIRNMERQDRLDDVKRMRLEAELADRNYRLKGLLTPPDQGLEDDPLFALPIKKEDGGAVPPRRTVIKGQPHMLSYINAEEAGILKALGGSGEPGPMGIPSYAPGGDKGLGGDDGGFDGGANEGGPDNGGGGSFGGGNEGDNDRGGYGMSPGRSQAQFGTTEFAGMSEQDAKDSLAGGGGAAAAANAQQDIAANAAQTRPQVSLTTVENPQETQDLLDVFASSTTPTTVDPTETNAVASTYSSTASDTLAAINDMLGLNMDLLADPQDMTDRQALARSAPAVDVTSQTAKAPDVLGMDDEYDDGIPDYSDPNRPGYKDGLPTGLEFADTRRGRFTTNLAGLTADQRAAMPGYMSPKGKEGIVAGLMNMAGIDPSSSAYGYEFDDTGRVTGMVGESQMPSIGPVSAAIDFLSSQFSTPPETTEDLLNSGVYTGFGAGSMPQGGGGGGDPIIYPPLAPEAVPQDPVSNVMGGMDTPYVAPPSLPSPLVPSDRAYTPTNLPMPVGYGDPQTGYINPLAYLTSGFPVGTQFFADGGQVLDQAAGRFLEALTAA